MAYTEDKKMRIWIYLQLRKLHNNKLVNNDYKQKIKELITNDKYTHLFNDTINSYK